MSVLGVIDAPWRAVAQYVLKHGMRLMKEAQADPGVKATIDAAVKAGNDGAGAHAVEQFMIQRIKHELEPWNWDLNPADWFR